MPSIASVRASTRRQKNPETTDPTKISASLPDSKLYGIYGPQYAAMLAAKTGATGADIVNRGTLGIVARQEQENYARELAASREAEEALQASAQRYGVYKDRAGRNIDYTELGMGGAEEVAFDEQGTPFLKVDPIKQAVGNANVLNSDQADRFGVYASGTKTLADAGYGMTPEEVGKLVTPPTQMTPQSYGVYKTPEQKTREYSADEGMTVEQQMEVARLNAAARDKGDDIEYSVVTGTNGVAQVTAKGSAQALIANGIDPATGQRLNPNAGASGGDAPATPAATPRKATPQQNSSDNTIRPIRDGRSAVARVYPNLVGNINQVERDPNSRLGRANPNSWHNRTKAAIDIDPIKGMTFESYVKGYEDAGYKIIEKKNEVGSGRSKHATGDHWHVVLGEQNTMPIYAQRLASVPNVAKVNTLENGDTLVQMKNGEQRVYRKGKRIG